jgi:predicted dehydrogenase
MATMKIGMGLVGAGFVGPHHIDAVRRLGNVEVVAIAGSSEASAREKADALGVPKAYGDFEALIADPDVQVVHNATPNHLHYRVNAAALARRKHIISDKPLAMTAAEARSLVELARTAGVVHAVTFNYRGNPLVQQARHLIARGDIGRPHFVHGGYLQDWLLKDTDYSWRLEPEKNGASSALADIGSHWCDLAQHVSGLRIVEVLAEITTVVKKRRRPAKAGGAFQAAATANPATARPAPSEPASRGAGTRVGGAPPATSGDDDGYVPIAVEDLASVLVRFDNGARGTFSVGQVCAGHKNDLRLEVCGSTASLAWRQERQNELWIGRRDEANATLMKDPSLLDPAVRSYAHLPGGHQEAWADAFCNVMRDIYGVIAAGKGMSGTQPPAFATFEDGCRANCLVDAMLASASRGGVWTPVAY